MQSYQQYQPLKYPQEYCYNNCNYQYNGQNLVTSMQRSKNTNNSKIVCLKSSRNNSPFLPSNQINTSDIIIDNNLIDNNLIDNKVIYKKTTNHDQQTYFSNDFNDLLRTAINLYKYINNKFKCDPDRIVSAGNIVTNINKEIEKYDKYQVDTKIACVNNIIYYIKCLSELLY